MVWREEKEYVDPPPAPLLNMAEVKYWSFYRALIAEFIATLLLLYVTVTNGIGHKKQSGPCDGVSLLGIAWAFGGMIFILVYCTTGISGGHVNPTVTFGLFWAKRGAFMKPYYDTLRSGANSVALGYGMGTALGAEIVGTFVLVYTVFLASDSSKRDMLETFTGRYILSPLPIGFAVFMVHLATIPITGTGINPARSLVLLLSTTTKSGMTSGSSGLDHLWDTSGESISPVHHQRICHQGSPILP
ncbi:hypothetical protein NL676_015361 [Syzygium grande]|nr:hypothetical protein NL676_015361 [Syzygium grande]